MHVPIVIVAPLALFGIWCLACAWGWFQTRRRVLEVPSVTTASLVAGPVEVTGRVVGTAEVRTPFSGRICAWWHVEVQTGTRDAFGQWHWTTRYTESSSAPFLVMDDAGYLTVQATTADVTAGGLVIEPPPGREVPRPCERFMQVRNLGMRHVWGMGPMRFVERSLVEGTTVCVLGQAETTVLDAGTAAALATGTDELPFRSAASTLANGGSMRRGFAGAPLRVAAVSAKSMTGRDVFWIGMGIVGLTALGVGLWTVLPLVRHLVTANH